jgi:hypothetical protein
MSLTKGDKEWIVKTIKDMLQNMVTPIDKCLASLRITVFGETGQNGINGTQKKMAEKQELMEESIVTLVEQMKQVRSTAIFWTRLVGGAALMAIVTVLLKLLLHQ